MAKTYKNILKYGSYANYIGIESKDPDVLYFCTDNGKLFKGSIDFSDRFVVTTAAALPATGVPGNIYYITDENKWKTYLKVGNTSAYYEIGNPIDKIADSTTSTITAQSADDHVPSSKNVYTYGQEILAQATGGSAVVKTVGSSANDGKFVVTYGDDSTNEVTVNGAIISVAASSATAATVDILAADDTTSTPVVVPGVITGAAAGTNAGEIDLTNSTAADSTTIVVPGVVATIADSTTEAAFKVTPTTGTAYDVTVSGVVKTPTWNTTTRTLTLPVAGGETVTVDIGKDIFVQEGYYDATTQNIVLILNNDDPEDPQHPIIIPAAALVDVYTGGATASASVSVSTSKEITATVKLDTSLDTTTDTNAITVVDATNGGLRVSLKPVYDEIDALSAATTAWGTF